MAQSQRELLLLQLCSSLLEPNESRATKTHGDTQPIDLDQFLLLDFTTVTLDQQNAITNAPEIAKRDPSPIPQDSCQDASQQVQQASQQASESIRQASQQGSQSAQQASQSASNAVQQATNSASQSIAAASRSMSSMQASAGSAISSAQSSASSAVSRANASMSSAQLSASAAAGQASSAVLQAGAAVAAATGKAAAAGSSFLSVAAAATLGAEASVSAAQAQAQAQADQAGKQVKASQAAAITATQAAVAIVGSIIASTLLTILIYFLVVRHRKKSKKRAKSTSKTLLYSDPKVSRSASMLAPQPEHSQTERLDAPHAGPEHTSAKDSSIAEQTLRWDPKNPPKPPSLRSWLKVQTTVSPFGPITLPSDEKSKAPLGGQLKSPLMDFRRNSTTPDESKDASMSEVQSRSFQGLVHQAESLSKAPTQMQGGVQASGVDPPASIKKQAMRLTDSPPLRHPLAFDIDDAQFMKKIGLIESSDPDRASKVSIWVDDVPDSSQTSTAYSTTRQSQARNSIMEGYKMHIPKVANPVRSTAEWLAEQSKARARMSRQSWQRSATTLAVDDTRRSKRTSRASGGGEERTQTRTNGQSRGFGSGLSGDRVGKAF